MVVRECVADRTEAVLEANLFDLHQKYAEVTSAEQAIAYVRDPAGDARKPLPTQALVGGLP